MTGRRQDGIQRPQQTGAIKNDKADCKVEVGLFPPSAYYAISTVFTYGKHKYDSWNWAKGLQYSRMYDALQRHLNAWYAGQDCDPETGFSHLWHAGCNIAMLIHTELNVMNNARPAELDDRPLSYFPPVIMESFSSILKNNEAFQAILKKKEAVEVGSAYHMWASSGVHLVQPVAKGISPEPDQNTEGRV